jgi:transcriptional regulator with XRE-family HTH domain
MDQRASTVGAMLRALRVARGKSQLALAVEAGVSTRHLSFVETGRAAPSREMVLMLAERLDLPLRERNSLLQAAGYAAVFRETPLADQGMAGVRAALEHILDANGANPTLVVNRRYDVLLANSAAIELLSYFAPRWRGKNNLIQILLSDTGLKPSVVNYHETASHLARRVRAELAGSAHDARDREIFELATRAQVELAGAANNAHADPIADVLWSVRFRRDDIVVDLFTTITTLGTPLDITLQELRIETFFPMDEASRERLARLVRGELPASAPAIAH